MRRFSLLTLLLFAPILSLAAPGEDHWTTDIDPETAEQLSRSKDLVEQEQFDAALDILRRLTLALPANADVFNLLGFSLRNTGDLDASRRAYERALLLNPSHLSALEYQGELYLKLDDVKAAEANLAKINSLCQSRCEELVDLAEAIEAWRKK